MNDDNFYTQLLTKVLTGEASETEQQQLQTWAEGHPERMRFVEETHQIWTLSEQYLQQASPDTEAAWQRLQQRLNLSAKGPTMPWRWIGLGLVLVSIVGGLIWWASSSKPLPPPTPAPQTEPIFANLETQQGERKIVVLPDGSKVTLNGGSTLRYDQRFEPRRLELSGEAYFEVVPDVAQPFSVETGQTRTTVLGTSFNVRAYQGESTEVAVLTGKVSVQSKQPTAPVRVVLPGEVATHAIGAERIEVEEQPTDNALAWQTQALVFENQPLRVVMRDVERYFGVTIKGDQKLLNCRYTGTFKQPTLEEVLQTIAFAFPNGIRVQASDDQQHYQLEGKGCE